MPLWLKIYLLGCVFAIAYSIYVLRDEKNRADINEILFSISVGIFSWLGVLALWVGQNINSTDDDD